MTLPQAQEQVEGIVRGASSSFFWPMRILPKEKREALYAVYAFCREVDDAVDNAPDSQQAMQKLIWWQQELEQVYDGHLTLHPVGIALKDAVRKFRLPKEPFLDVIQGCILDAQKQMLRPTLPMLERYCAYVAGSVGLLVVEILGYKRAGTRSFALEMGQAVQLINILRDVEEDAHMGRIYLPREWLEEAGMGEVPPEKLIGHPGLPQLCVCMADKARRHFRHAKEALPPEDAGSMRIALLMGALYEFYLDRMTAESWQPGRRRPRAGFFRKTALFCKVMSGHAV